MKYLKLHEDFDFNDDDFDFDETPEKEYKIFSEGSYYYLIQDKNKILYNYNYTIPTHRTILPQNMLPHKTIMIYDINDEYPHIPHNNMGHGNGWKVITKEQMYTL